MILTKLTLLSSSLLIFTALIFAEEKSIDKDKFLLINPNITKENLRAELENLAIEFEAEKEKIHSFYSKEIKALKEKKRLEIKSMKNGFGEKREALFIKYGEKRTKPKKAHNPNIIKKGKGKKPRHKSK
tara:strand:+ start:58 stop:444 length:387 start_codon:yes stop_codon:yes gene_type:complete